MKYEINDRVKYCSIHNETETGTVVKIDGSIVTVQLDETLEKVRVHEANSSNASLDWLETD